MSAFLFGGLFTIFNSLFNNLFGPLYNSLGNLVFGKK
jgi:hypothetical protein